MLLEHERSVFALEAREDLGVAEATVDELAEEFPDSIRHAAGLRIAAGQSVDHAGTAVARDAARARIEETLAAAETPTARPRPSP